MLRGVLANALSVLARFGVQLVSLPVLLASWDGAKVGTWLMLITLPAYLSLTASGFPTAGGNAMIEARSRGQLERAKRLFGSVWAIVTATNLLTIAVFLAGGHWLIASSMFELGTIPKQELVTTVYWLCLYVFINLQTSIPDCCLRYGGRYPTMMTIKAVSSLLEIAATVVVATHSSRMYDLAAALCLVAILVSLSTWVIAFATARELFTFTRPREILPAFRGLWRPSLAFMAAPLVFGFNIQGYTLLVGGLLGPIVLASFVATRTLARTLDQLTSFQYAIQFYEFAYWHSSEANLKRRVLATSTSVMLAIALAFLVALLVLGGPVQQLWTLGKTSFDIRLAAVLAIASLIRAVSSPSAALLGAANRNAGFMQSYIFGSAVSFGCAVGLAWLGLPMWVIASCLILAEFSQLAAVLRHAARGLACSVGDLLLDILRLPSRVNDLKAFVLNRHT